MLKKQIRSYLKDYLTTKYPDLKVDKKYFDCPFKGGHSEQVDYPTANLSTNHVMYCSHPSCGKIGDIFALVRRLEDGMSKLSDDDIADYIIQLFDIKTDDKIDKLLNKFMQFGFDLVPIQKNGKAPVEKEWTKKNHLNKQEWLEWLDAGLNIGCKTGKISKVIVIDIDQKEIPESLKPLLNDTLVQETNKGWHYFYVYEGMFPKTFIEVEGVHIDIETDGGQVVIEPSTIDGVARKFNQLPIAEMTPKLIKFLDERIAKNKVQEKPKPIDTELSFENLNSNRNNTFIKLGGELRKKMNVEQTGYSMYLFNNLLDKQLPGKELKAMLREIEKYRKLDVEELGKQILERLDKVEEATIRDLTYSLRQEQKDIEDVLRYLVDKDFIYKRGTKYRLFQKADWKENFIQESRLLDFKVPYFHNYATFRNGDMLIIGAKTGLGKTHIAVNIIKKLVEQGIKPDYISSEPGNRFTKIALTLGLKEGEFRWCNNYRPERLELDDNTVTIVDWLLPDNYAETDKLYQKFAQQLDKHSGILIIFTQLKSDGSFFAQNMVDFFASVCCTYNMTPKKDTNGNTSYDTENTFFETRKIRESKSGRQHLMIPTYYNPDTKILEDKT